MLPKTRHGDPGCGIFPFLPRIAFGTEAKEGERSMSEVPQFLKANERYAASFKKGHLPMPPARHVAVVACMDARLDPARVLGLEEGDAHVIRNAGGRAADAFRSLVISQQLLGTREVVVIHHTDCGMLTFTDAQLRKKLADGLGVDTELEFLPFSDVDASVRDDVAAIRKSPLLLRDLPVAGFVYDVKTGKLRQVV
jgi:carbonic anhydrase